jgi:hypothetical protein
MGLLWVIISLLHLNTQVNQAFMVSKLKNINNKRGHPSLPIGRYIVYFQGFSLSLFITSRRMWNSI